MLFYSFNFLENLFYNACLVGISVLGFFVYRLGLLVIYLSSCEMGLEVSPCLSSRGFVVLFSTYSAKIDTFVMRILPVLILLSFVSGVPYSSFIALYLEITLKTFTMESEWT